MKTTAHPFMLCNPDQQKLFSVNPGISQADAIDMAQCLISSAGNSIVEAEGRIGEHHAYLIAYALELAQALTEALPQHGMAT